MYFRRSAARFIAATALAAGLAACATPYTGPVEVTRFVAEDKTALAQGPITLEFPEEMSNQRAQSAFADAVASELTRLGYAVQMQGGSDVQVATIRTSRGPIQGAVENSRSPVSVGVGGRTGTFGSGVGLGLGINLGGGRSGPAAVSQLSVRITATDGQTLWEGRAQQAISVDSPYADVDASARALAAGLFNDFPGGNGETVTISVDQLPK